MALGLSAGPVVALGFTRFAYALLLPVMRRDLEWSYAAAGGMTTANALGYVLGAATAAWWAGHFGTRRSFGCGLAISAVALLASGATGDYPILAALRFVGGVGTAVVFVVGSLLATRVAANGSPSGFPVAVYMSGVGVGIVISGLLVPAALSWAGALGWRVGWILLGVLSVIALAPAIWAGRQVPEPAVTSSGAGRGPNGPSIRALLPTLCWYVLFGAGYVSYMTFAVALLQAQGLSIWSTAGFFVVLGAASALATLLVWGRVIDRLRAGRAPALVAISVMIGVVPVLVWPGTVGALISAVVFGAAFMAGPTAVTVLARRVLAPAVLGPGLALLTVAFSVGQASGPLVIGFLSDGSAGIVGGLWLAVALLALAAVAAFMQREHPRAARRSRIRSRWPCRRARTAGTSARA